MSFEGEITCYPITVLCMVEEVGFVKYSVGVFQVLIINLEPLIFYINIFTFLELIILFMIPWIFDCLLVFFYGTFFMVLLQNLWS